MQHILLLLLLLGIATAPCQGGAVSLPKGCIPSKGGEGRLLSKVGGGHWEGPGTGLHQAQLLG